MVGDNDTHVVLHTGLWSTLYLSFRSRPQPLRILRSEVLCLTLHKQPYSDYRPGRKKKTVSSPWPQALTEVRKVLVLH